MDRLREWWNYVSTQLGVLTVSQRLAIGLCAALAVMSLLWLLQWSTAPDMVPLVTHDFSFEELTAAEQALRGQNVAFETRGTRLFVRAADRHNALRVVNEADALPDGSLFDMAAVVQNSNPFQSPEARSYAQTYAKGNELAKIIATSPYVRQASVVLNPVTKRRLGKVSDVPTASVIVTLTPSREMTQEMVEAFAKLVAGAVAGLKPHNVFITDARTLRSYSLPHPDDATAIDVLTLVKRREAHYRSKILSTLADIPGVRVAVTVDLDMTKRLTRNVKHDPVQPKVEQESTTEQSPQAAPTEPGVQANLGQALTAGNPGTSNTSEERTTENFEPQLSQTETIEQMPFAMKSVTAVVGIPRSFVVGVFRAKSGRKDEDPKDDDPVFTAVRDTQIARVKASVERIVMAKKPTDVTVDVYPDMEWTAEGGVWSRAPGGVVRRAQGTEGLDTKGLVQDYGPQVGLAMLALISLLLVARVVRQSSNASGGPRSGSSRDRKGPVAAKSGETELSLAAGGEPVGQAVPSEGVLAGREIDPETLRLRQIRQEVSGMVDRDPEGAAALIRRWIRDAP